ncbi:uncharacterized protein LOC107045884 [Diachasma alloeum]|uniref:uncharacterized protein LOC107045884 n=1 Tax=Diachasma alloeum TaxID=454923 RepID=UPI0007384E40|nr:uncharacterized protein LOC107045884 [Diachasma alloeum]
MSSAYQQRKKSFSLKSPSPSYWVCVDISRPTHSIVVQGKILLQDLWKLKCSWDDPLPQEYIHQWESFRQELTELDKVAVPRWLRLSPQTNDIQFHGFADASTVAMSAMVYIRTQNLNEPASTVLVCAKTKVAQIKCMTIPRLELTAALLLTQLVTSTQQMLQLDQRHVSGKENPADCASRGITPSQLADHHLWWTGPDWINQDPEDWPRSTIDAPPMDIPEVAKEAKPAKSHPVDPEDWPRSTIDAPSMDIPEVAKEAKPAKSHPVVQRINEIAELLNRYSMMAKLLAVTATINRAIDRFRELNDARLFWVKITQHQYFVSELRVLLRNQQLPRNHQLAKLTPTLDEEGIMRLGGRLKNSELHPEQIHPIILPRQSRFTTLVIAEAHQKTLHGGTQLTLAYTRQRYWILGGRGTVRAYILRCAICARHRARQAQQQMGQLPATRVSPARAFLHTGVDYAGPFAILKWRPTNAQPGSVHIAVFVCFTTSAVHLELVNRQTTEAFLGAYKRFTGRRGIPAVMYSDNATTFVGAADQLERLYTRLSTSGRHVSRTSRLVTWC